MRKFLMAGAVALVLAQAAGAQPGRECEYGMNICESYAGAELVFVGTVTRVVPETFSMKQYYGGYDQTAYVAVEKIYKGARRGRVVLRQRGQAEKFVARSRYLFYANYDRAARLWEVRPCGNTRLAAYAQDDLRFLDALPASAARTRVSGEVAHIDPDEVPGVTRLPGVRVKLSGGGRVYETTTDADGLYEFTGLPPGRYRIEFRAPAGLVFYGMKHTGRDPLARARELEFELPEGGCAGAIVLFKTDEPIKPGDGGVGTAATFRARRPY